MSNESARNKADAASVPPGTADTKPAAKKAGRKRAGTGTKAATSKPAATTGAQPSTTSAATARTETMTEATPAAASDSSAPAGTSAPRDGHYMNKQQLAYFSTRLTAWKQQLMEEVDRTVGHMKDDATNFPDPNDRATQEEEFSLELRTRDRERKLIKKINEAQKRIDDDEYGYCESCGVEIGVARLEARLTAELCIDCKTLEEIRERQNA